MTLESEAGRQFGERATRVSPHPNREPNKEGTGSDQGKTRVPKSFRLTSFFFGAPTPRELIEQALALPLEDRGICGFAVQ